MGVKTFTSRGYLIGLDLKQTEKQFKYGGMMEELTSRKKKFAQSLKTKIDQSLSVLNLLIYYTKSEGGTVKYCQRCNTVYSTSRYYEGDVCIMCHKKNAPKNKYKPLGYTQKCIQCGKEYEPYRKGSKFCSSVCSSDYRRILPKDGLLIECKECGKVVRSFRVNQKFCSVKCSNRFYNKSTK